MLLNLLNSDQLCWQRYALEMFSLELLMLERYLWIVIFCISLYLFRFLTHLSIDTQCELKLHLCKSVILRFLYFGWLCLHDVISLDYLQHWCTIFRPISFISYDIFGGLESYIECCLIKITVS